MSDSTDNKKETVEALRAFRADLNRFIGQKFPFEPSTLENIKKAVDRLAAECRPFGVIIGETEMAEDGTITISATFPDYGATDVEV